MRTRYPAEFRQQLVELVRAGRSARALAREFEPSEQTIRNWVKQADLDTGRRTDGLTSEEQAELRRLRRENRQLKLEREILKKAGGLVCSGDQDTARAGFEFVRANQATYPVRPLCRLLGVSPSGYYAWRRRGPSARAQVNAQLLVWIRAIHRASREAYGAPNIQAELQETGWRVNHKRVARLMRLHGIVGVTRRKYHGTTRRDPTAAPAPDLVARTFTAARPDQLWVADITYLPTWAGFLYLAIVLDVCSRRIVGWAMGTSLATDLVVDALNMAVGQRRPTAVIHHSDQGCQYTSLQFGRRCREAGVRPSMGSVGDAYDNAMAESFFATLECELLDRRRFRSQAEAKLAVFDWIEGWYNSRRRHSALGRVSPLTYERRFAAA
ncbi:MAG: IS3 family transposase [Gemmatimonadales bacterium]